MSVWTPDDGLMSQTATGREATCTFRSTCSIYIHVVPISLLKTIHEGEPTTPLVRSIQGVGVLDSTLYTTILLHVYRT